MLRARVDKRHSNDRKKNTYRWDRVRWVKILAFDGLYEHTPLVLLLLSMLSHTSSTVTSGRLSIGSNLESENSARTATTSRCCKACVLVSLCVRVMPDACAHNRRNTRKRVVSIVCAGAWSIVYELLLPVKTLSNFGGEEDFPCAFSGLPGPKFATPWSHHPWKWC